MSRREIDPCPTCGAAVAGIRQRAETYRLRPCGHSVRLVGFLSDRVALDDPVEPERGADA